jgi:hypothetical protein
LWGSGNQWELSFSAYYGSVGGGNSGVVGYPAVTLTLPACTSAGFIYTTTVDYVIITQSGGDCYVSLPQSINVTIEFPATA